MSTKFYVHPRNFRTLANSKGLSNGDFVEKESETTDAVSQRIRRGLEVRQVVMWAQKLREINVYKWLRKESADRWKKEGLPLDEYWVTWDDFEAEAERVGKIMFQEFNANAVLTFSGPSMIFAGLAMRLGMKSIQDAFKMPVYTGFFVKGPNRFTQDISDKKHDKTYDLVRVEDKFLLVPSALCTDLGSDPRKIAVLDDVLITGRTKQSLIGYFRKKDPQPMVKFGCAVCTDDQIRVVDEYTPECQNITHLHKILMPWRQYAFPFEKVAGHSMRDMPVSKEYWQ